MNEHRLEFTESENPWSPTTAVQEINERTGADLELIGLDEQTGGTSSAAYVRWPDGRESALTRTGIPIDWMHRTAGVLSALRAEGLPVPRHDLVIALSDGRLAVVQERLPGRPLNRVEASHIDAMIAANDRFARILANRRDLPTLPFFLRPAVDNQALTQPLATWSGRTRRLLEQIREIVPTAPRDASGDDLVHPDYGLGNVLFDESGNVTGVVDWNGGAERGDRRFALLKLAINIEAEGDGWVQQDAIDRLDEIVNAIDPTLRRLYWAQWTLRSVSHAIQNGFPIQRIDHQLRLGEDRLG